MSESTPRSPLSRALVVLAALAVAVHLFGLYRPAGPPSPSWFPHADKLEHLVGFGAPVFLILITRWRTGPAGRRALTRRFSWVVVGVFALHAVVSELIQHFFYTARTGDPLDVLADWTGVAVGAVLAMLVVRHDRVEAVGSVRPDRPGPR